MNLWSPRFHNHIHSLFGTSDVKTPRWRWENPPPPKKQLEASLTNQWCHGGYVHLLYYLLLSLPFLSKRKGQPLITLLVDKYRCSSYFENFGIANKLGCLSRECLTPQTDTPSYWTSVMPNLLRLHACTRTAVAICSPTQWRWRQLRDKRFIEETASFQQYAVLIKCKHLFILLIVTLAFGVSIVAYSEIISLCRPDAVSCFTAAALRKVTQIYMYTQTS